MSEAFTCIVCGRQRRNRSHFMWLATAASATVGGRILIGLAVLGLVLALLYGPFNAVGRS